MSSYSDHAQGSGASPLSSSEGKRNKRTRVLSALLSATALGFFLEGCGAGGGGVGGGSAGSSSGDNNLKRIVGGDGDDTLIGSSGDDIIIGGAGRDTIIGGAGADTILGGPGDDDLDGGDGGDLIIGGEGADRIDGGEYVREYGDDTASYQYSSKSVRVDLSLTDEQLDFEGEDSNANEAVGDILTSIEDLIGSDYDDWLSGDDENNELYGGAGNDLLEGREGHDGLYGGIGNDHLKGGGGVDNLYGGAGEDILDGGAGEDYARYDFSNKGIAIELSNRGKQSDLGDSSIEGSDSIGDTLISIEHVVGSNHADYVSGDGKANELRGLQGDDILYGRDGDDQLEGDEGDDRLYGEDGEDRIDGGWGDDHLYGGDDNDQLYGDADYDGPAGDDTLYGEDGHDRLYGSAGVDSLYGGSGDDVLDGGTGADILDGGDGTDVASYNVWDKGVRVNLLLQGEAQVDFDGEHGFTANGNDAVGDILSNIERVYGSEQNDWLTGDGDANVLAGSSGDDRIDGEAGDDELYGGHGADVIDGGIGDDELEGYFGEDFLQGGVGDDILDGGGHDDILDGGSGDDTLYGDAPHDGFTGADLLSGSATSGGPYAYSGDDTLIGGIGNDFLLGGFGEDTLDGGEGKDEASYRFSSKGVRVDLSLAGKQQDFEGEAINENEAVGDILSGIEDLEGSQHDDWLTGDAASNELSGADGDDLLDGGDGSDTLYGGSGDDRLAGGAGADILDGGSGEDTDYADYSSSSDGVRVDLSRAGEQLNYLSTPNGFVLDEDPASEAHSDAVGDLISNIEAVEGSRHDDWLTGDDAGNELSGADGDDLLAGGGGSDTLYGGSGDDHLEGGAGADVIDGGSGAGTDYADYSSSSEGVRVDLSLAGAQLNYLSTPDGFVLDEDPASEAHSDAVGDLISNIEVVLGTEQADWLTGNEEQNLLSGNGGDDVLEGLGGGDTLYGLDGDDVMDGGAGTDIYLFRVNDGVDTISDEAEAIAGRVSVVLRFQGSGYDPTDFDSTSIVRSGNDLVLNLDVDDDGEVDNRITVLDAYNDEAGTGVAGTNAAFTIAMECGSSVNHFALL